MQFIEPRKIYPNIEISEVILQNDSIGKGVFKVQVFSTLRFLNQDGKYYLTKFLETKVLPIIAINSENDKIEFRNRVVNTFLFNVEMFKHHGIADTKSLDQFDQPFFTLDTNQESEKERINNLYNYGK